MWGPVRGKIAIRGIGLGVRRAGRAEEAIARSESIVDLVRLSGTDVRRGEQALRAAKDLLAAGEYGRALLAAREAESIAVRLNELHARYETAAEALREQIRRMHHLGLLTKDLEAALRRAEETVTTGVRDGDEMVPNFAEGAAIVEQAARDGHVLVDQAETASNAIFLAEMAINALADLRSPNEFPAYADGATSGLLRALEGATRKVAMGDFEDAMRAATELESRARRLQALYYETSQIVSATAAILADLREKGVATGRQGSQLAVIRDALARGMIEPAVEMARRLLEGVRKLGDAHRTAAAMLASTEELYAEAVRGGLFSPSAESALIEARQLTRAGEYGSAVARLERARMAVSRGGTDRASIARLIEESRAKLDRPNGGAPFLPDIQELLRRAEQAYLSGDYAGSNEDLTLAQLLLKNHKGNGSSD